MLRRHRGIGSWIVLVPARLISGRMRTEEAPLTAARRTSGLTLGLDSRPSYQRYSNVYDKI